MSYISGRISVDNLDNLTNQLVKMFSRYYELEEQKKDALISIADSLSVLAKKDALITENAEIDSKNSSCEELDRETMIDNLKEIIDYAVKYSSQGNIYLYDDPETKEESVDWGKLFPSAVG